MKNNLPQLVRDNIQKLKPYTSARDEYSGLEGIFLDANENPFGKYNRYPDPYQNSLKLRLAEIKNVHPNSIFLGNGSDEIIDLAFRIFCEPNQHKALTLTPTYGMYEVAATINNVELIQIPLNDEFQIDKINLLPILSDSNLKLIIICSPNNPTGNLLNSVDIELVLHNFKGIVLVDEAYIDFCPESTLVPKLEKYSNLIISQTLSKAWGLAGVRLGIAIMNPEIVAYYNKVKAPYNISTINQQTALDALYNEEEFYINVNHILIEKENLIKELKCLKIVKRIFPSNANFLLVEMENANEIYSYLIQNKIIIRNRNSVIRNCVRISVGTTKENKELITALKLISNG
jgi:histidinol-phosphate aminotransferase